jgi:hypothetical protein
MHWPSMRRSRSPGAALGAVAGHASGALSRDDLKALGELPRPAAADPASHAKLVAPGQQPIEDKEVDGEDGGRPQRKDEHDQDGQHGA